MNTCIEKIGGKTVSSALGFDKVHSIEIDRKVGDFFDGKIYC